MRTPRTLSSALSCGYIYERINYKYNERIQVILKPRFYNAGMKPRLTFWMNRKRFIQDHPIAANNHGII